MDYRVTVEIDVTSRNPEEAAREGWQLLVEMHDGPTVDVRDGRGREYRINLAEEPEFRDRCEGCGVCFGEGDIAGGRCLSCGRMIT